MVRLKRLKTRFWESLSELENVSLNGDIEQTVPGIMNVSIGGVDGETMLMSLHNLAVSSGSACNSASVEPSYVLKAMGVSDEMAYNAIRISLGRFTTDEEIDYAINELKEVIVRLRALNE
jgi:cysteine desulfurase